MQAVHIWPISKRKAQEFNGRILHRAQCLRINSALLMSWECCCSTQFFTSSLRGTSKLYFPVRRVPIFFFPFKLFTSKSVSTRRHVVLRVTRCHSRPIRSAKTVVLFPDKKLLDGKVDGFEGTPRRLVVLERNSGWSRLRRRAERPHAWRLNSPPHKDLQRMQKGRRQQSQLELLRKSNHVISRP